IKDPHFFVRQQYQDFLGREPDQAGMDYWTKQIDRCGGRARGVADLRVEVSTAFSTEKEFQDTSGFIYRLFGSTLGRAPSYAEFTSNQDKLRGASDPQAARGALVRSWVTQPVFTKLYPAQMSIEQFVAAVSKTVKDSSGVDVSDQAKAVLSTG